MSASIVEISGVSRSFGKKVALDEVSLSVPAGCVMGLVGENGAGKTTLLKHVLGLFRAQSGTVRVFDKDPVLDPETVLGEIGYLSEVRDLPDWMKICELLDYTRAFFPAWDEKFAEELREMFELSPDQKIKTLSRGQRARAGLIAAIAHRPKLLVLDEPSSGLDPVVRRDILSAIIRTVADEGRTVLFSSHLLDEVQRVSDQVAMLHLEKMLLTSTMDDVLTSHHRLTVRFEQPWKNH
jgi:ABC-2 type transport system ATP-binding protein